MYDELIIVIRYKFSPLQESVLVPLQEFPHNCVTFLYMLTSQQPQASFSSNDPSASDGAHGFWLCACGRCFDGYQKEHGLNLIWQLCSWYAVSGGLRCQNSEMIAVACQTVRLKRIHLFSIVQGKQSCLLMRSHPEPSNDSRIRKTELNGHDCNFQSEFAHTMPYLTTVSLNIYWSKHKYWLNI